MAGAGYKLFNTGDVLLASEVNTYLMQQTVMVFANSTARTSALSGVLAEGMISYLADTNATEVYNGTAWVGISGTGMTNPMTTTGDTIYSSSGSTPARLGIGSTGQVLTVAGGVPSWATPSSGGMTLLSTTTLSGASTTLSAIDQTYNNLILILKNTTNDTANGITSIKPNGIANKVTQVLIERTNVNVVNGATAGDLSMAQGLSQLRTSTDNIFIVTFYNYADTGAFKAIQANCYFVNSTNTTSLFINAGYIENTAISSLEIYNTGGNWSAGTALLYGVK